MGSRTTGLVWIFACGAALAASGCRDHGNPGNITPPEATLERTDPVEWRETTAADFSDGLFELTGVAGTGVDGRIVAASGGSGRDGAVMVSTAVNLAADAVAANRTDPEAVAFAVAAVGTDQVTATAPVTGIAVGDEVLLINMRGDAAASGNAGTHEFLRVAVVAGDTLTFTTSIQQVYGATTDNGDLTGQAVVVQRVPQYTDVSVTDTGILTTAAWDGSTGGVLAFRATGTVSVAAGGVITVSGLGYRGGLGGAAELGGVNGESYAGFIGVAGDSCAAGSLGGGQGDDVVATPTVGDVSAGGGGGDVDGGTFGDGAGGGGGGSYAGGGGGGGGGSGGGVGASNGGAGGLGGVTGIAAGGGGASDSNSSPWPGSAGGDAGLDGASFDGGKGGLAGSGVLGGGGGGSEGTGCGGSWGGGGGGGGGLYGTPELDQLFLGGGAGGGGGASVAGTGTGGAGGDGGAGGGILFIAAASIDVAGTVSADGASGTDPGSLRGGRGGSGAGGSIRLVAETLDVSGALTAIGGPVIAFGAAGGGGGGGVGRVRLDASSLAATSNPPALEAPLSLPTSARYTSSVFDSGRTGRQLLQASWDASTPAGTQVTVDVRAADTAFAPSDAAPAWETLSDSGAHPLSSGRYVQYRLTLSTPGAAPSPDLAEMRITLR